MTHIKGLLLILLFLNLQNSAKAETWDEPWQKEIIQQAEYFVLAKVISSNDSIGAEIEIMKSFGAKELKGTVLIDGFYMLRETSSSGQGHHLPFKEDQTFYFFLKKRKGRNYAIPTPTCGFAFLDEDKNVYSTYRHSYHQALVPQHYYEKTYTEIWNYYKNKMYNSDNVVPFINEYIDKDPAGFEEDEIATFFLQHVAMESAYLLDLDIPLKKLKKFVESDNFHSRVSALQLLGNSKDEKTKEYLFEFIKDKEHANFEIVIAIWSLGRIGDKEYFDKLKSIADELSDEFTSFGGDLMDPRVGTDIPNPQRAVHELK